LIESDKHILVKSELWFPYTPIITLTSVTVAGDLWVVDEDYVVKPDRLLSMVGQWLCFLGDLADRVEIVGKFGYAQASAAAIPTEPTV
jgi:hypothetical protein